MKKMELYPETNIAMKTKIWKLIFLFNVFSGVRDPFEGLAFM
jgi:hypothetical protein